MTTTISRQTKESKLEIFEIPDNSKLAEKFRRNHPQLYKFLMKYENQTQTKYALMQRSL